MVIGHNLPFDLGALSIRSGPSRGENYGGLTLPLQADRPGVTIKKIGFGKHFYGVHQSRNQRRNNRFVDTMQLGRALLGASVGGGLDAIAKGLGIKEILKGKADYDGPITEEYIDYCRNDVNLTWNVFIKLRHLLRRTMTSIADFAASLWLRCTEAAARSAGVMKSGRGCRRISRVSTRPSTH